MAEYGLQLKKAETTGSAKDLDKATQLGKQFNETTNMLNAAQNALSRLSKLDVDKERNSSFD